MPMTSKVASHKKKIHDFFHDISSFFKFHDFSMHGFFSAIFQVFQSLWELLRLYVIVHFLSNQTGTIVTTISLNKIFFFAA